MELQLKNIGMIKEASVKIDGLTVIAGENDTGKSTVGKALYVFLNSIQKGLTAKIKEEVSKKDSLVLNMGYLLSKVFQQGYLDLRGEMHLITQKGSYSIKRDDRFVAKNNISESLFGTPDEKDSSAIYIESPLVWNFTDFFRDIAQVESQMDIKIDYPYLMKDLNFKLHIKSAFDGLDIKDKITSLIGGEFKKDELGHYYFDKEGQRIEMINTATGIKMFALFQILSQNNYLNNNNVLILDEPEVHLHPKWQLEIAKIIIELVRNGVKVLVNSHSPYMIEALERYAEKAEVPVDFYLAEDGMIDKVEDDNSKTLAKIFHKLSAPYETFNQMDSETLKGG